jgi:hypothetical protein
LGFQNPKIKILGQKNEKIEKIDVLVFYRDFCGFWAITFDPMIQI